MSNVPLSGVGAGVAVGVASGVGVGVASGVGVTSGCGAGVATCAGAEGTAIASLPLTDDGRCGYWFGAIINCCMRTSW